MDTRRRKALAMLQFLAFSVLVQLLALTHASTLDNDLNSITDTQKVALEKFKQRMVSKVPHDYMKEDVYLFRWLRAKNYNVDLAEQMLNENLKWRRANNMDTILQEDWSEFNFKYPYHKDTFAKSGNPIFTANIGDWDIRSVALAGRLPKLIRYMNSGLEEAATIVRELQKSQGKNATISQYEFFVNLNNYNLVQHGCIQCLSFYLSLVNTYENYYPSYADHLIIFNTPRVFEVILKALRPLISPFTRKAIKVRGEDKEVWGKLIYDIADKSQLRPDYGGTYNATE